MVDEVQALKDKMYQENLDGELAGIRLKIQEDPTFTPQKLQTLIDTDYFYMDDDWAGRGEVKHLELQARISAMEIALHEWQERLAQD